MKKVDSVSRTDRVGKKLAKERQWKGNGKPQLRSNATKPPLRSNATKPPLTVGMVASKAGKVGKAVGVAIAAKEAYSALSSPKKK